MGQRECSGVDGEEMGDKEHAAIRPSSSAMTRQEGSGLESGGPVCSDPGADKASGQEVLDDEPIRRGTSDPLPTWKGALLCRETDHVSHRSGARAQTGPRHTRSVSGQPVIVEGTLGLINSWQTSESVRRLIDATGQIADKYRSGENIDAIEGDGG